MNSFSFGDKSSADFGLYISDKDIYSMPAKDVALHSVLGRNGDILVDYNSYQNVPVSYTVGIKDIKANIKGIKAWLSQPGYLELADTYNPDYFRLACFNSNFDVPELLNNIGQAVISFSCKPFMYSYDGKRQFNYSGTKVINNPEAFSSLPLIRVYVNSNGDCTFYLNGKTYTIKSVNGYIDLDSELMCAFRGSQLQNNLLQFTEFPILQPGDNTLSFGANIKSIQITPRWRTL